MPRSDKKSLLLSARWFVSGSLSLILSRGDSRKFVTTRFLTIAYTIIHSIVDAVALLVELHLYISANYPHTVTLLLNCTKTDFTGGARRNSG